MTTATVLSPLPSVALHVRRAAPTCVGEIAQAASTAQGWRALPDRLATALGGRGGRFVARPRGTDAGSAELCLDLLPRRRPAVVLELRGIVGVRDRRAAAAMLAALAAPLAAGMERALAQVAAAARPAVAVLAEAGAQAAVLDGGGGILAAAEGFAAQFGAPGTAIRLAHADAGRLAAALAACLADGVARAVPVRNEAGALRAALHLRPDHPDGRHDWGLGTVTAALVRPPRAGPGPDPAMLRDLFDLTPAEARVAALLAAGRTVDQVAAATATAVSTVRCHLKHVFDKLGVARQIDLALLVQGYAWGLGGVDRS